MADQVIVERDRDEVANTHDRSNMGTIVGVIAVVLLILLAIFALPGLLGTNNAGTGTGTGTTTTTPAPAVGE